MSVDADPSSRVIRSGLVSKTDIEDAIERLVAQDLPITEANLLDDFVRQGKISLWQAAAIGVHGKWKGFFFDGGVFVKLFPLKEAYSRSVWFIDSRVKNTGWSV